MTTPHINSKKEDIAKIVIMTGDPLRAEFISKKYLTNVKKVNSVRNMLFFTGIYKNKQITIAGSGMGIPSMGIYSYELFKFYDVDVIIRLGTAGSYTKEFNIMDLLNVKESYSESSYAKIAGDINKKVLTSSKKIHDTIKYTAKILNYKINSDIKVHSSDVFYTKDDDLYKKLFKKENVKAVEMETFALFTNAIITNKLAGCVLMITDNLYDKTNNISWEKREKMYDDVIIIVLESTLKL